MKAYFNKLLMKYKAELSDRFNSPLSYDAWTGSRVSWNSLELISTCIVLKAIASFFFRMLWDTIKTEGHQKHRYAVQFMSGWSQAAKVTFKVKF